MHLHVVCCADRGCESVRREMATRERKFFVGGNWKMNGSKESINGILTFLKEGPLTPESGGFALHAI